MCVVVDAGDPDLRTVVLLPPDAELTSDDQISFRGEVFEFGLSWRMPGRLASLDEAQRVTDAEALATCDGDRWWIASDLTWVLP